MSLLAEVEAFLRNSGIPASSFGRQAAGDPGFVWGLRRGRVPRAPMVARVRAFMTDARMFEGVAATAWRQRSGRRLDPRGDRIVAVRVERLRAECQGPLPEPQLRHDQPAALEANQESSPMGPQLPPAADRGPCWRCGVRGARGCAHQAPCGDVGPVASPYVVDDALLYPRRV